MDSTPPKPHPPADSDQPKIDINKLTKHTLKKTPAIPSISINFATSPEQASSTYLPTTKKSSNLNKSNDAIITRQSKSLSPTVENTTLLTTPSILRKTRVTHPSLKTLKLNKSPSTHIPPPYTVENAPPSNLNSPHNLRLPIPDIPNFSTEHPISYLKRNETQSNITLSPPVHRLDPPQITPHPIDNLTMPQTLSGSLTTSLFDDTIPRVMDFVPHPTPLPLVFNSPYDIHLPDTPNVVAEHLNSYAERNETESNITISSPLPRLDPPQTSDPESAAPSTPSVRTPDPQTTSSFKQNYNTENHSTAKSNPKATTHNMNKSPTVESKVIPMSQTAPPPQSITLHGTGNIAPTDTITLPYTTTLFDTIERPPYAAPRMSTATTTPSQTVKPPDHTIKPSLSNNHAPKHNHTTLTCLQSQSGANRLRNNITNRYKIKRSQSSLFSFAKKVTNIKTGLEVCKRAHRTETKHNKTVKQTNINSTRAKKYHIASSPQQSQLTLPYSALSPPRARSNLPNVMYPNAAPPNLNQHTSKPLFTYDQYTTTVLPVHSDLTIDQHIAVFSIFPGKTSDLTLTPNQRTAIPQIHQYYTPYQYSAPCDQTHVRHIVD